MANTNFFKLGLLEAAPDDFTGPTIKAGSRKLRLVHHEDTVVPPYTCVSYVWGAGRSQNPYPRIGPSRISDRTLRALEAAVEHFSGVSVAFWIDAFCVPVVDANRPKKSKAERQATLESMGYIYSKAGRVAVVLPDHSYSAIDRLIIDLQNRRKMRDLEHISHPKHVVVGPEANFDILEDDGWIRSVWTYQEVMNNDQIFFLSDELSKAPIPLWKALNALGDHQSIFRQRSEGLSRFDEPRNHPELDDFITLGGDWMSHRGGGYALRVMANLDHRAPARDREMNYWHARIAAVTTDVARRPTDGSDLALAARFIEVCIEVLDFSFIFSATPRECDANPGTAVVSGRTVRNWCPAPVLVERPPEIPHLEMPAILPVHSNGARQKGTINPEDGALYLSDMTTYSVGPRVGLRSRTKHWFQTWHEAEHHLDGVFDPGDAEYVDVQLLSQRIFGFLHALGFTGSQQSCILEDGLFFAQSEFGGIDSSRIDVLVSTAIRHIFGAPALLRVKDAAPNGFLYTAGVLVGEVDPSRTKGSSITLK